MRLLAVAAIVVAAALASVAEATLMAAVAALMASAVADTNNYEYHSYNSRIRASMQYRPFTVKSTLNNQEYYRGRTT